MNGAGKKRAIQFLYVLRKNFLLQWRRPISTTLELLCPLIAIIVLIIVRHTVPQFAVKKQCFITFDSDHLVIPYTGSYNIYFAPNSTEAKEVASIVQSRLPGSTFIPTKNQDEFITNIQKDVDMRDRGCFINGTGIFFNNITNKDMVYTLRLRHETPTKAFGFNKWYTRLRSPGIQPTGPRVYDNAYLNEGFLHLEHIVGLALIEWKTGRKPDLPPVSVRQLPYPPFDDDEFLVNIDFILPFFLMAAFLVSAGFLTKELVLEKETRMREMMRMMGLSQGVLWVTWFIKQFLFLLLPFVVLGILFWGGKIFPKSNVFALLLFMVVFLLSLLSFCFLVSVWFDDSRLGLMAGFIFWFLTYFPHLFLAFFYDTLPLSVKIVSCLLSNTCMGLAVNVISLLELRGDGLQFSNYGSPLSLDDQFSMLIITAMLLVDSIIYLLIAWYINEVKPGQYGIPRKPYFFLQSTYWTGKPSLCCKRRTVTPFSNEDVDHHDIDENDDHDLSVHELITPEPQAGIEITNLHKKFKPRLYSRQSLEVVNIQKLKIYKGQITALLGHNGAGKTTTMSILTGLFPPTSGSVIVNGHSVTNEIDKVRQDLGVCPQVNVLFDRMTVNEHLWYFTKLKNIKGIEASDAINDMLSRMDLERNKNKRVLELSGGNKRKLSVAIAMIGNPSVVILDEPTSGMDNNARQMTWNLLRDKAATNGTTILVSTHSIDDTEMADRIVIMVHGKIKCSGRPPFLKEKYKVGYNLRIQLSEESDPQLLEDTIKRHVKKYWVYSFVHHHEYTLPYDEMKSFPYLFGALEATKKELGIISFSMQENSMEDVFISSKEGRLLSANDEHRQRTASIHNPSTLPQSPSWMTATTPSSPSLLNFPDSSAQFQGFFQSAPQSPKMDVIAEESSGVETSSSQLQEDIDGPMANVLPGFPAVDQSYNAKDYYKKSHFSFSGLSSGGLQQIQQSMVAGQHESTPRLGHVGFVNRSRSSSGANESIPSGERRFGMLSRTTVGRNQTLSRSRPLIGRPSILNDIIDLDEKDEEDGESLWAREAEEAVDFGHGKYDVEQLVSPEPQDKPHACGELELDAGAISKVCKGATLFMKHSPGRDGEEHSPTHCTTRPRHGDL